MVQNLPLDCLSAIFAFLDGVELYKLWKCGNTALCKKMGAPNVVKHFGMEHRIEVGTKGPRMVVPRLISVFQGLTSLSLLSGYAGGPLADLNLSILPKSLTALHIRAPNALAALSVGLLRSDSGDPPGKNIGDFLPQLQHLSIVTTGVLRLAFLEILPANLTTLSINAGIIPISPWSVILLPKSLQSLELNHCEFYDQPYALSNDQFEREEFLRSTHSNGPIIWPLNLRNLELSHPTWLISKIGRLPDSLTAFSFGFKSTDPDPLFLGSDSARSVDPCVYDWLDTVIPPTLESLKLQCSLPFESAVVVSRLPRTLTDLQWRGPRHAQASTLEDSTVAQLPRKLTRLKIPIGCLGSPSSLALLPSGLTDVNLLWPATEVFQLPSHLKRATLAHRAPQTPIPTFPASLQDLTLYSCTLDLELLEALPQTLTKLEMPHPARAAIDNWNTPLPSTLKFLALGNVPNRSFRVAQLPKSLEYLYMRWNALDLTSLHLELFYGMQQLTRLETFVVDERNRQTAFDVDILPLLPPNLTHLELPWKAAIKTSEEILQLPRHLKYLALRPSTNSLGQIARGCLTAISPAQFLDFPPHLEYLVLPPMDGAVLRNTPDYFQKLHELLPFKLSCHLENTPSLRFTLGMPMALTAYRRFHHPYRCVEALTAGGYDDTGIWKFPKTFTSDP